MNERISEVLVSARERERGQIGGSRWLAKSLTERVEAPRREMGRGHSILRKSSIISDLQGGITGAEATGHEVRTFAGSELCIRGAGVLSEKI